MKNKVVDIVNNNTDVIRTTVRVIVVFVFIFGVILANCSVPTGSMDPTIRAGSRVIAHRLAYIKETPERKDVIIFKFPDNERENFLKRIIGLPGEVVEVKNGIIYIDGKEFDEDYLINSHTGDYGPFYVPKKGDVVQIKNAQYDESGNITAGECYIGNHFVGYVNNENDANLYKNNIIQKDGFLDKYCELVDNEYIVKEDTYFCMGDNRDSSDDARFWTNKYVTVDKIVGKVFLNVSAGFKKI